ncbi:lonely Cys domain-containing protein [Streptomyces lydicus]|nr:lonely Cys domain-containing protein [Streptomyces lydicus]
MDALRKKKPALQGGPLDLDKLARHVLLLDPAAAVTKEQRRELLDVAMDSRAEDAPKLVVLTAVHLVRRGVFHDAFRRYDKNGEPRGWDWSPKGSRVPVNADLGRTALEVTDAQGGVSFQEEGSAPWGTDPYLLAAESDQAGILLRGAEGFQQVVTREVFAALMAFNEDLAPADPADPKTAGPEVGPDVPILLAMSEASGWNLNLQDALVAQHGHDVWASNGLLRWVPQGKSAPAMLVRQVQEGTGVHGQWLLREPATVAAAAKLPHGGPVDWSRREIAIPVAGPDHRFHTYISMDFREQPDGGNYRSRIYSRLAQSNRWVLFRPGRAELRTARLLPWVEEKRPTPFFANMHGGAGWSEWFTEDGHERAAGPETGRRVARQVALSGLPLDHPLVVLSCFGAMPGGTFRDVPNPPVADGRRSATSRARMPAGADPLTEPPDCQYASNESDRTVFTTNFTNAVEFAVKYARNSLPTRP